MSDHSCLTCNGDKQYHGLAIVCSNCFIPCYIGCLPNKPETNEIINMLNLKNKNSTFDNTRETAYKSLRVLFASDSCFSFTCQSCIVKNNDSKNEDSEKRSAREKSIKNNNRRVEMIKFLLKNYKMIKN